MRIVTTPLAAALFAAFMLGAAPARADTLVAGSGKTITEKREASGFQGVTLHGSMKLVLRPGTKDGIEIRGDDNLLALVETRVVDRAGVPTLEIGTRRGNGYSTRGDIVVTVDMSQPLKSLSLGGSGDAVADGFKTGNLKVALSGAGDLKLRQLTADELNLSIAGSGDVQSSGHVTRASFSIAGSGDVTARELEADDVKVTIAGSGDARVNARKLLSVSIAGSGDVEYTGEATVKSSVAGSGSVKKK